MFASTTLFHQCLTSKKKSHQDLIDDVNDAATRVADAIDDLLEKTNSYLAKANPAKGDISETQLRFYRKYLFNRYADDAILLRKGAFNFNLSFEERGDAYDEVVRKANKRLEDEQESE
jgi:hypothetical protein